MSKRTNAVSVIQASEGAEFRVRRRNLKSPQGKEGLLYVTNRTKSIHSESEAKDYVELEKIMTANRIRLIQLAKNQRETLTKAELSKQVYDSVLARLEKPHSPLFFRYNAGEEYKTFMRGISSGCQLLDCCPLCTFHKSRKQYIKLKRECLTLSQKGYISVFATLVGLDSSEELDLYQCLAMFRKLRGRRSKYDTKVVIDSRVVQCFYRAEFARSQNGYRHHIHALFMLRPDVNPEEFIASLGKAWSQILKESNQDPPDAFHAEIAKDINKSFHYVMTQPFAKLLSKDNADPDFTVMSWFKFYVKRKTHGLSRKLKGKLLCYQGDAKQFISQSRLPSKSDGVYEEVSLPLGIRVEHGIPFEEWAMEMSDVALMETMPIDDWIALDQQMDRTEDMARHFGIHRRPSLRKLG